MFKLSSVMVLPVLAVGLCAASAPLDASKPTFMVARNSLTEACSEHAKLAGEGKMAPSFAIDTCTAAIQEEAITPKDLATNLNNRGVVQLTMMGAIEDARIDFEEAAKLDPSVGESYANRGAALVSEERYEEGIAEIEKGMAMGLREPWKAYFNRAIARERMNDIRGAYEDYSKALELRPGWALAQNELSRFTVRGR